MRIMKMLKNRRIRKSERRRNGPAQSVTEMLKVMSTPYHARHAEIMFIFRDVQDLKIIERETKKVNFLDAQHA